MKQYLGHLSKCQQNLVLMGDLNYPDIIWKNNIAALIIHQVPGMCRGLLPHMKKEEPPCRKTWLGWRSEEEPDDVQQRQM